MRIIIPWAKPYFFGKEKAYLNNALESTWISGGYYIERFESIFTRHLHSKYGITVSNGTTALQLAILALGIGPGDEVIIPGFTFAAPANMVIMAGATPVYADIDSKTWCIDPRSVENRITNKTKAIIPVHVYGNVCDMDPLKKIAKKHRLFIIEDAAEAAFSKYKGKFAGTFGDIGCFSFQATKTIAMGEGGFVLTNNKKLYEKMWLIRNHGMKERRYWHEMIGYNFRLTNLQAAVGYGQLKNLKKIIADRKRVYRLYLECLSDIEGITPQHFQSEVDPVVWAFALKINPVIFKAGRNALISSLLKSGIETRPGFYPFSSMPIYDNAPSLPVSSEVSTNVLSLPFFTSLKEKEIKYVCGCLRSLKG